MKNLAKKSKEPNNNCQKEYYLNIFDSEIETVSRIIDNASSACYSNKKFTITLFITGYGVIVAPFLIVEQCIAIHRGITIMVFVSIFALIVACIIMHDHLFKRQSVYRSILKSLKSMRENMYINKLSLDMIIEEKDIGEYIENLKKYYGKNWEFTHLWDLIKEMTPYFLLLVITFITPFLIFYL